jgi:hypothetical protein
MVCFAAVTPADVHWAWTVAGLLAVPALVALNGFFVAAEFALVAVRKTRVEELVKQGARGASAARDAVAHLDRTIAATQLGITLASTALGWVGEPALARLVEPLLAPVLSPEWAGSAAHAVAFVLAFGLITFMHVVFGELIPKTLALQAPDRTSLWVAAPLNVFVRLTRPFVTLLNGTGNAILRRCGYRPAGSEGNVHSVDELDLLIEDTREAGVISDRQAEFVRKVFRLSGRRVAACRAWYSGVSNNCARNSCRRASAQHSTSRGSGSKAEEKKSAAANSSVPAALSRSLSATRSRPRRSPQASTARAVGLAPTAGRGVVSAGVTTGGASARPGGFPSRSSNFSKSFGSIGPPAVVGVRRCGSGGGRARRGSSPPMSGVWVGIRSKPGRVRQPRWRRA